MMKDDSESMNSYSKFKFDHIYDHWSFIIFLEENKLNLFENKIRKMTTMTMITEFVHVIYLTFSYLVS